MTNAEERRGLGGGGRGRRCPVPASPRRRRGRPSARPLPLSPSARCSAPGRGKAPLFSQLHGPARSFLFGSGCVRKRVLESCGFGARGVEEVGGRRMKESQRSDSKNKLLSCVLWLKGREGIVQATLQGCWTPGIKNLRVTFSFFFFFHVLV